MEKQDDELTSDSLAHSFDSPVQQTVASLLNPSGCCHSGPVISDGTGWTSELRPQLHSESLRVHSYTVCHDTDITKMLLWKRKLYICFMHLMSNILFWWTFAIFISGSTNLHLICVWHETVILITLKPVDFKSVFYFNLADEGRENVVTLGFPWCPQSASVTWFYVLGQKVRLVYAQQC